MSTLLLSSTNNSSAHVEMYLISVINLVSVDRTDVEIWKGGEKTTTTTCMSWPPFPFHPLALRVPFVHHARASSMVLLIRKNEPQRVVLVDGKYMYV